MKRRRQAVLPLPPVTRRLRDKYTDDGVGLVILDKRGEAVRCLWQPPVRARKRRAQRKARR
jgi:hypothetical protein